MFPSPGYGGSCFPKDIRGVVNKAKLDGFIETIGRERVLEVVRSGVIGIARGEKTLSI